MFLLFLGVRVFCLFLYCREVLGRVGVADGPGGRGGVRFCPMEKHSELCYFLQAA